MNRKFLWAIMSGIIGIVIGAGVIYRVMDRAARRNSQVYVSEYSNLLSHNRDLVNELAQLRQQCASTRNELAVARGEASQLSVAKQLLLLENEALYQDNLWQTIQRGDADGARRLLKKRPELANATASNMFQETWLHKAAYVSGSGSDSVVKVLLEFGADPDVLNTGGESPKDIARRNSPAVYDVLRKHRRKPIQVSAVQGPSQ